MRIRALFIAAALSLSALSFGTAMAASPQQCPAEIPRVYMFIGKLQPNGERQISQIGYYSQVVRSQPVIDMGLDERGYITGGGLKKTPAGLHYTVQTKEGKTYTGTEMSCRPGCKDSPRYVPADDESKASIDEICNLVLN